MFWPAEMRQFRLEIPLEYELEFLRQVKNITLIQLSQASEEGDFRRRIGELDLEKRRVEDMLSKCNALIFKVRGESLFDQLLKKAEPKASATAQEEEKLFEGAGEILLETEQKLRMLESMSKDGRIGGFPRRLSSLLRDNLLVYRKAIETEYFVVLEVWAQRGRMDELLNVVYEACKGSCLVSAGRSTVLSTKDVLSIRIVIEKTLSKFMMETFEKSGSRKLLEEPTEHEPQVFVEENLNLKSLKVKLLSLRTTLSSRLELITARMAAVRSDHLTLIRGWIKVRDSERLKGVLDSSGYKYILSVEDVSKGDYGKVPVLLENPPIIRDFELLTVMFGLPKYPQIDPTPIVAVTFAIFFGIMFADVFDGILLVIFGVLLYRGLGSSSLNTRMLSRMIIVLGLSAIVFGFLTGEFLGGLVALPVIWFNGLQDPFYFLQLVLIFGIVQLTGGFILGIVNEVRVGGPKKILVERISWLLILYGGIILLLSFMWYKNSQTTYAGAAMALTGLVLLVLSTPLNVVELPRIFSNVVSYARIMAINMSHVGIARAFTLLATLVLASSSFVGPILAGVILLLSHIFLAFVESFVAFAHTIRLHYVEFFSKFYESGGKQFKTL